MALQLKLSELVLSQKGAHNSFVDLEHLSDAELEKMHAALCKRAEHTLNALHSRRGKRPTKTPHRQAGKK
jgi:low affinity Fe/Cu permease